MEKTLAIIKPIAFKSGFTGPMITQIEQAGFKIKIITSAELSLQDARAFYAIHADKHFYQDLCKYMSSGPVIVMVLVKKNAIEDFRKLIGATNPAEASANTLRKQYGKSIDHNAIHGSDSPATAANEIRFFFGRRNCAKDSCGCADRGA